MNDLEKLKRSHMPQNSIYYEHSIELCRPLVSRLELFILTVLSVCLHLKFVGSEFVVSDRSKNVYLFIGVLVFICLVKNIFWGVKKESVFIIKSLGLQITVIYVSNFKSSKFIPWHLIDDIVINEAILIQQVIYYLAVLIKSEKDTDASGDNRSVLPLFLHARPRLAALKNIYSNFQTVLQK